jgi:hypothetical protein
MEFQSVILALAFSSVKVSANPSAKPCLVECVDTANGKECTFTVSRDQYASELAYYKFSGENGDCGSTNPTLGQ